MRKNYPWRLACFWNKNTQRAKETKAFSGYFDFNITLDNIESAILSCYRKFINDTAREPDIEELREFVRLKRGITKIKDQPELLEFIDQFIKRMQKPESISICKVINR